MNGGTPQRFSFALDRSMSEDPRLMGMKGDSDRQKKLKRLLSMKYNQR